MKYEVRRTITFEDGTQYQKSMSVSKSELEKLAGTSQIKDDTRFGMHEERILFGMPYDVYVSVKPDYKANRKAKQIQNIMSLLDELAELEEEE